MFMVPIEVPIHNYFSEPQNYNPVRVVGSLILLLAMRSPKEYSEQ